MHKCLQVHAGHIPVKPADLVEGQFAGQYRPGETLGTALQQVLRRAVVHLGGGVQRYGRQGHLRQRGVLHNEGVHTCLPKLLYHLAHCRQLAVIQDGIDRHVDTGIVGVGKFAERRNLVDGVACSTAGTVARSAYVYRICTVQDGLPPCPQVAGGS